MTPPPPSLKELHEFLNRFFGRSTEARLIWILPGALVLIAFALLVLPGPPADIPPERIWEKVQREAARHELDPLFVYAVAMAESSLDPLAANGSALGLMQLTPRAWEQVAAGSHRNALYWDRNIEVGTAYLAWVRDQLQGRDLFSYPRLAAGYRWGVGRVIEARGDLSLMPETRNRVYRAFFAGNLHPVPPPGEPDQST